MARTIESQIGAGEVGDCAECGAVVSFELTQEDMELAEELDRWKHPRSVYRDCPACGHDDASILVS